MTEDRDPIDGFISEISASLKEKDPQAFLRRVNAERMLALVVNELIAGHAAERIRILPDNRLTGEAGADFLLQVDDYDFRLELVDAPAGERALNPDLLRRTAAVLEENPSTLALIFVWTTDELEAVPLSLARIRFLLQNPARAAELVSGAKPVKEVIEDLIQRQIKVWDIHLDPALNPPGRRMDLLEVFSEEIGKAIDVEMHRPYRNEERSQAAREFPYMEEKQMLLSALQDALKGAEPGLLADRLAKVQRRNAP